MPDTKFPFSSKSETSPAYAAPITDANSLIASSFKKGPFTMAARAGVRLVPISIVGTHVFGTGALPIASPRGVRIIIHPPIDAPAPKTGEDAAMAAARAAVISGLPLSMRPTE